jgi:hypothetical protein
VSEAFSRSRGLGELLRELARGSGDLIRGEVRLARMELSAIATGVGRGTAQAALGTVLLLLGSLAFATGIVLLAGDQWLPKDRYWLAALIVLLVTGGLALLLVKRGLAALSPSQLKPDQTLETLKEDTEWLKRRLKSGETSS